MLPAGVLGHPGRAIDALAAVLLPAILLSRTCTRQRTS